MIVGRTSGGSPIFYGNSGVTRKPKKRVLIRCTACHHAATSNQAKSNGFMCSHCKAPLRNRQQKLDELNSLQRAFNLPVTPNL